MWMFGFSKSLPQKIQRVKGTLSEMILQGYNIPACPLGSLLSILPGEWKIEATKGKGITPSHCLRVN